MASLQHPLYKILFIAAALMQINFKTFAQVTANNYNKLKTPDSSGRYLTPDYKNGSLQTNKDAQLNYPASIPPNFEAETKLIQNIDASFKKPKERRQLMAYLKQLTANNDVNYNRSRVKLFYRLANTFARLRLYPLAMKCFFKTMKFSEDRNAGSSIVPDSLKQPGYHDADSVKLNEGFLIVNSKDDSVINVHSTSFENTENLLEKSKDITYQHILNTFNDGKEAVGYAVLFHVKQPVPGKRKIFAMTNTGHTFITLIKYNTDSTYVSLSFGFYPHKDNFLSATPLVPETSSVFKNDSEHEWDEVLGKFISKRRFEKILLLTKQYNGMKYHLSKNNCTDFGLNAANLAGINIEETSGKWPLGKGNNPAVTGQSILQGEFKNLDAGSFNGLFIDSDLGTKR
ncbi:MAG: hypothetical protein ACXVB0_02895 [Mucilaginibacter sp.]